MRNDVAVLLVCSAILLLAGATHPSRHLQSPGPPVIEKPLVASPQLAESTATISKNVEEVRLVFTVLDRHGRTIPGLGRQDVLVRDAGSQIAEFTSFVASSDLPLRLGLLVDSSDSMRKGFAGEQLAAAEFLERVLRPGIDVGFVLGFSATGTRKTSDEGTPALVTLIRGFQPGGQTSLYDAICAACSDELISARETFPVRRVIVLLSDGEDTQSRHNLQDAIASAQRAEIAVYAVSVHSSRYEFPGDRVLKELAAGTGGRAFILNNYRQLAPVFAQIEDELRSQYVLTYRRSQAPSRGGFHPVQVVIRKQPGLRVNCRRGYFAAPGSPG